MRSKETTMVWAIITVAAAIMLCATAVYLGWPRQETKHVLASPAKTLTAVQAPKINGISLRDWLIHHVHRDGVWTEVVNEFYDLAANDPEIGVYFAHTDMDRLKRHFLSTLLILVHTGLTAELLEAMRERHAGLGITGPVFDRTIRALAGVLSRKGVPDRAIADLGPAVAELRAVIVEPGFGDSSHPADR